jgi:CRISPR-associated protein Cmr3
MPIWMIEPHDTLVVRDGRPFNADIGARAHSLPFVTPSMIAGAVRQRIGSDASGKFVHQQPLQLLQHAIRGPLLYNLKDGMPWVSAPADALLMGEGDDRILRQLTPIADARGCTNLPVQGAQYPAIATAGMAPVGFATHTDNDRRKPNEKDGIYWSWDLFCEWLLNPCDISFVQPFALDKKPAMCIMGSLQRDTRTHVQIDASRGTVGDEGGRLFSTQGLQFRDRERAFGIAVDVADDMTNRPTVGSLGGERRLVSWRQAQMQFPAIPAGLIERIVKSKKCRVVVLTPAYFAQGWYPGLLLSSQHNVQPTLMAAAAGRAQVLSGWDMAIGKPKSSKRYMGAGSVYYLELAGTDADIATWVANMWFQNISDEDQSRRDGFGLAVVGVW